ncbi:DUF3306 domain-containing protein [Moritella viscosa]
MATNFFQRWSSRSLTAKDKASTTLSETNEAVEELTESKQFSEPVYDANAEINQAVTLDKVTNDAVDKQSDISDKSSDDVLTIADADSVTFDSGVVSFLKQGVDKSVKKAALAKLFHSDEFNYISDMDDHTEDFSNIPKLDDSIAKQLRGWVNAVLEEPEQVEALCIERVEEVKFSAVEDETVEPVTEDFKLSQGCDDPRHKTIQQGET